MKKEKQEINSPSLEQLEMELHKELHRSNYSKVLRNTIYILITVAAAAVLIAVLVFPVLQITGTSMTNTLQDGDIAVVLKGSKYETGDVVAFYYNNSVLVKRVIGYAGDWIDIDEDGNVFVNGEQLDEPYVTEKALGDCDLEFPYQVPDNRIFVLGDHRATSTDSRSSALGCIDTDLVIGKLLVRVWPLSDAGLIQ
jgi:signal peptidase I